MTRDKETRRHNLRIPLLVPCLPVSLSASESRRSLTNVLAAFMEERNILWGELAGGLLIVGCSIALVITLWHSLEALPYFPFLIFACITAALFGAGEYTLHHWKLESTSRGLLVIALLLVPLNLLVLADPSLGHANTVLEWIFKIAALLLALGMVRLAGRDLIGVGVLPGPIDRRWLLMLAIVGAAGSQLIVPRLLDEASGPLGRPGLCAGRLSSPGVRRRRRWAGPRSRPHRKPASGSSASPCPVRFPRSVLVRLLRRARLCAVAQRRWRSCCRAWRSRSLWRASPFSPGVC